MDRLLVRLDEEARLVVWDRDKIDIQRGTVADLVRRAAARMRSRTPPDKIDLAYRDHLLTWPEIAGLRDHPAFPKSEQQLDDGPVARAHVGPERRRS